MEAKNQLVKAIEFKPIEPTRPTLFKFLNTYIPAIGTSVKDEYFNTKKLTKTSILNQVIENYFINRMRTAYIKNETGIIKTILTQIISISHDLKIYEAEAWRQYQGLTHSIGNEKIGNDTLCISINTSLLCYMGITGNCSNCKICYARNSNKMYSNEFLKNTISQLNFISYDALTLAAQTIQSIKEKYTKKQIKNLKFLRWNVNGDILNQQQLLKTDIITYYLKKALKIPIAYSYSHNKKLNYEPVKNIVFNCSDHHNKTNKKTVQTRDTITWEDLEKYNICNGDCNGCSYCKDQDNHKKTLFLKHGGQRQGVHGLNPYIMHYITEQKNIDYLIFIRSHQELQA